MVPIVDAYRKAVAIANVAVPSYIVGSKEHELWLAAFDKAFAAIMATASL